MRLSTDYTGTNANARWTVNDHRSPWMTPGNSRDASGSLFVWPMPVVVPSRLSASSPPPRPVPWGLTGPTFRQRRSFHSRQYP
ncbi:unnamed protein product [Lasius platythorax]|uniref:Uncharacterized protein n=1 Tax=Lasius platythorax TaxID=488582 RepID=A0AAV2NG71_9HYME